MKSYTQKILTVVGALFITVSAFSQNITGTVYDEKGQTMPGVTVRIEASTKGDASDMDGKYSIENVAPGQYTLVFTFIGYKDLVQTVTMPATGNLTVNKNMEVDAEVLSEFVVVGYGVQRKREVTGSITTVKPKDITDIPAPSFEAALQGKAAGVQVTQGSGMAGSASVVRIRGIASISAGGDPLYVVDGIPITQDYFLNGNRGGMNTNPLATINPNDIESIDILKDAAATGIYGSRGANGVILITTKRGRNKGVKFDFSARLGTSHPTARPNMLNSSQYLQLYQEAWENDGNVGLAPLPGGVSWDDARKTDTDWVDETIGVGFKQAYNLGVSRGWDKVNAFFGVGYEDNGTFLIGNSYERTSFRTNIDWQLAKNLKLGFGTSLSRGVNNRVSAAWSGGLGDAMSTALPIYPIYWGTDKYSYLANGDSVLEHAATDFWTNGPNPVRQREGQEWRTQEWRSLSNVRLDYEPVKNLIVSGSFAFDYMDLRDDIYTDKLLRNANRLQNFSSRAERYPTWVDNWNTNVTANYMYDLDDNNSFTFLVGSEYQQSRNRGLNNITREDPSVTGPFFRNRDLLNQEFIPQEIVEGDTIAAVPGFINGGSRVTGRSNFISYFARVNYDFKRKYFAQVSARVDGSSKFGANNRYGFFPSASAGWILSDEAFIEDLGVFSFLKLTAGVGLVGNAAIPDYQQYGSFAIVENSYNNEPIRFLATPSNPDIRWETANIIDASLEMGFFEDRLTSKISVYKKNTRDVLLNVSPQPSTGFDNFWDNLGRIVNQGVELEIGANIIDSRDFIWRSDLNIAYNDNKITSIGDYSPDAVSGGTNDTRVVVGAPVGTNFLVRFSHVDSETGRPVYLDLNGNPTFTWDPANRVPIGRVLPKAVGGWTNTWTYKRWEVGLVVVYSLGANIYDSSSKRQLGVVTDWNMRTEIFDRWRQPGDEAAFPRLTRLTETHGAGTPWINTDMWLHQGDYMRFRRLSVTYNLPSFTVGAMKFDRASVTASAMNFFTITNFGGLDPEIARDFENVNDRNMSPNISYLTPPQEMSFVLQFNLNF